MGKGALGASDPPSRKAPARQPPRKILPKLDVTDLPWSWFNRVLRNQPPSTVAPHGPSAPRIPCPTKSPPKFPLRQNIPPAPRTPPLPSKSKTPIYKKSIAKKKGPAKKPPVPLSAGAQAVLEQIYRPDPDAFAASFPSLQVPRPIASMSACTQGPPVKASLLQAKTEVEVDSGDAAFWAGIRVTPDPNLSPPLFRWECGV